MFVPSTSLLLSYITYGICAIALIIGSFSIYFIQIIWTYREHAFIKPRSPLLSYSILWMFFTVLLLAIINALFYLFFTNIWKSEYFFILENIIQYTLTLSYATRAWILFYFLEYSYESVNYVWRTQMISKYDNDTNTGGAAGVGADSNALIKKSLFYIKNKQTLGNPSFMFPIIMGLFFPLFIAIDVVPLFIPSLDSIIIRFIHLLIYIIIFLITYYWVYKIHQVSDKYYIAKELSKINASLSIFIIITKIINIMFYINDSYIYIYVFINNLCIIFSIILCLYFSTFWTLRKLISEFAGRITLRELDNKDADKHIKLKKIVTIGIKHKDKFAKNKSKSSSPTPFPLKLNDVLDTKIGFELFTQFLLSELSVENILFLVEVKQYKACCRKYNKNESRASTSVGSSPATIMSFNLDAGNSKTELKVLPDGQIIEMNSVEFPDIGMVTSLRSSTTTRSKPSIFSSKSIMNVNYLPSNSSLQDLDPYDYAMYLYNKYVNRGCDMQINISGATYSDLTQFLIKRDQIEIQSDDNFIDEMFKLYDQSWEEIFYLTKSDSFSRFRFTKEYEEVCHANSNSKNDKHSKPHRLFVKPKLPTIHSTDVEEEEDSQERDMLDQLNNTHI